LAGHVTTALWALAGNAPAEGGACWSSNEYSTALFELNIGTPVTPALEHVHTNVDFSAHLFLLESCTR